MNNPNVKRYTQIAIKLDREATQRGDMVASNPYDRALAAADVAAAKARQVRLFWDRPAPYGRRVLVDFRPAHIREAALLAALRSWMPHAVGADRARIDADFRAAASEAEADIAYSNERQAEIVAAGKAHTL